jgi:hypothetical protein
MTMTTRHHNSIKSLPVALVALTALLFAVPRAVWAIDTELAGIRVGSTPTAVSQHYGSPHGILARRSDGSVSYVASGPLTAVSTTTPGYAPTPERGPAGYGGTGQALSGSTAGLGLQPVADIVRVSRLGRSQIEWIYVLGDLRRGDVTSIGVVITGQGADAVVSDVIVASLGRTSTRVVTEKGIRLGDPLSSVISRYGFPTGGLVTFQAHTPPTGTTVGYATPTAAPAGPSPSYGGTSTTSAGGQVGVIDESIVVNLDDRSALFTKSCIARYGEIDFTFCDMKVVRIHVAD